MLDVHTIRLRGPWQLEPVESYVEVGEGHFEVRSESRPAETKAKMPADWSDTYGSDFYGQVRYTRRFHEPTGLEELEQVWLVVEPPRSHARIYLNGSELGEVRYGRSPARWEVSGLLSDFNVLEILVAHPELDSAHRPARNYDPKAIGGLIGEARLEIGFP